MAYEVRVDCPSCLVEGTRIELWDAFAASCRLGVPAAVNCRLCGFAAEGSVIGADAPAPGEGCPGCGTELDDRQREERACPVCHVEAKLVETRQAQRFAVASELEGALDRWAREEGLGSAHELVDIYFSLPDPGAIFASITRGERVETSFDVADYLFSGGAGATGHAVSETRQEVPEAEPTLRDLRPSFIPLGGAREELLALASVAAADGEAGVDDLAVLTRAAAKRGLPALEPHDIRVWRPNEIAAPPTLPDRERVLEEMFQMGWSDGQMDESEFRVIRDFSRAWGIDPERLREWTELYSFGDKNRVERWFRRIGQFLFPER